MCDRDQGSWLLEFFTTYTKIGLWSQVDIWRLWVSWEGQLKYCLWAASIFCTRWKHCDLPHCFEQDENKLNKGLSALGLEEEWNEWFQARHDQLTCLAQGASLTRKQLSFLSFRVKILNPKKKGFESPIIWLIRLAFWNG